MSRPKAFQRVIVIANPAKTTMFHAHLEGSWPGRTRCGIIFDYRNGAHHWGRRDLFSELLRPCRRCYPDDEED